MNQPVVQPLVLPERWDLVSSMAAKKKSTYVAPNIGVTGAGKYGDAGLTPAVSVATVAAKAPANTATTTISQLPIETQRIININAASQGMTGQQYLASRGGVNPVTGFYGDAANANLLTDAEYLAAKSGTSGIGTGVALNTAYAKKTYDNTIAAIPPKAQGETDATYNARVAAAKQKAIDTYNAAISGQNKALGVNSELMPGGTEGLGGAGGLGGTDGGLGLGSGTGATGPTLASDTFKATLALFFGQAEMSKPWVNELYNVTSKYYKTGSTIDESFNLALQDSRNNPALTEFTKRFKGIYALQDKKVAGQAVSVPTIAEYYASEAKMGDILRQAGLGTIATEDYLGGVIGKGLSVTDVGNYISGIYNEIQNLPKDIKDSVMTNYPNMDSVSLAKAILTGDKGFVQLQKELTSQELFGAAKRQGLAYDPILNPGGVTMDRATEYAAEGLDLATGLTKFGQVAALAPRVNVLSELTANKQLALTQAELESAVIGKNASQIRKMEQLTEEELARYRGNAGTTKVSLKGPAGSF